MSEREYRLHRMEDILGKLFHPGGYGETPASKDIQPHPEISDTLLRFMDEMPGGFLIYRADGDEEILYANTALLRIFRCDTLEEFRQLTGGTFRGMVYPEDFAAVEEGIRTQVAASQYDLDYVEYRIRCKDGAVRWVEDYGHFIRNEAVGDVFYVFISDATEKRRQILAEKTRLTHEKMGRKEEDNPLTEEYDTKRSLINQEYLRHLEVIEGLSVNYEGICYLDLDEDQIVPYRLSSRTEHLFEGHMAGEPYSWYAGKYVSMWVHPEDREMVRKATSPEHVREVLSENQTYYFNYRAIENGELQYLQLRYVNVSKQDNSCQAIMGYRRVDDEVQQQMEQQALLAEALAKANLAVLSKNTFLSNISHDMRTPLNAIFGFTSLAKMSLERPEEAAGYLDQVETSSRQLLEMIEKVLDVSSKASDSGISEMECDLKETTQKVYDFLRPQAQEKGIDFIFDCSGLRHKDVLSDPEKLRQLVIYLTNNAVTYTGTGGKVTLSIEEGEELPNHYADYRLSVKDTGIGIAPEFLDKIFEPFSREKNSTLSGVHSIGLGLTIAKNIVDMMGGKLEVQSKVNEGSIFTATLRLRHQVWDSVNQKAAEPEKKVKQQEQESTMHLLLVEDNELNREIEAELLERLGLRVDSVESGRLALELIRQSKPGDYDLIIMDLQMPDMDGWQTSKAIRELPDKEIAGIPIIAISANDDVGDQDKSKASGINAHLSKPLDLSLLLRVIEKVTGRSCRRKKG